MKTEIRKQFFERTDETGRHVVVSERTGKTYAVEPIGDPHIEWGSYNPATGNIEHKKGAGKHKGSITEKESLITEENGFKNIKTLPPGVSPMAYIEMLDSEYPDKD